MPSILLFCSRVRTLLAATGEAAAVAGLVVAIIAGKAVIIGLLAAYVARGWQESGTGAAGLLALLRAPLFLSQAAAPELRRQQGCIVNITDMHVERPKKGYVVYSVAKAGAVAFVRSMAGPLRREGITISAICPGLPGTSVTSIRASRRNSNVCSSRPPSRIDCASSEAGGSIATRHSTWSMWFCSMSRIAPPDLS